jgi:hypothetical protein
MSNMVVTFPMAICSCVRLRSSIARTGRVGQSALIGPVTTGTAWRQSIAKSAWSPSAENGWQCIAENQWFCIAESAWLCLLKLGGYITLKDDSASRTNSAFQYG